MCNRIQTLAPFLYFTSAAKGARVMVVSNLPGRSHPIHVLATTPHLMSWDEVRRSKPVQSERADGLGRAGEYDVIVVDQERPDQRLPDGFIERLRPEGSIVWLTWFRSAPWATELGRRFHLGRLGDVSPGTNRRRQADRWRFLVEPDLKNPKSLVLWGRRAAVAGRSRSRLKRLFIQWGGFNLLPHQQVRIASGTASSIVESALQSLSGAPDERRPNVKDVYVSTTDALIVRAASGNIGYFLRFPFSPASESRSRRSQEILGRLAAAGIPRVPRVVSLADSPPLPCHVEQEVPGANVQFKFRQVGSSTARRYFESAQNAIEAIHERFGRMVVFGAEEACSYVQPKVEFVASHRSLNANEIAAVRQLGRELISEFSGKRVLVTLVHGDFKIGNCLFDSRGALTGIVDWDMAEARELAVTDIASLLGRSLRDRRRLSLPGLLVSRPEMGEFDKNLAGYFARSKTDRLSRGSLLLLYWLDRVHKQLKHDPAVDRSWVEENVGPVVGLCRESQQARP